VASSRYVERRDHGAFFLFTAIPATRSSNRAPSSGNAADLAHSLSALGVHSSGVHPAVRSQHTALLRKLAACTQQWERSGVFDPHTGCACARRDPAALARVYQRYRNFQVIRLLVCLRLAQ